MAKYPMQFDDKDVKSGSINVGADGCLRPSNLIRVKCGSVEVGCPVRISAANTVSLCGKGNEIAGIVKEILENKECLIATQGEIVTLPYTGATTPSLGFLSLEADGNKGVCVSSGSSRERLVLAVDTTNATVTFIL